jgi:hypothetical protein
MTKEQKASISIDQHRSASISIDQHRSASISIDQQGIGHRGGRSGGNHRRPASGGRTPNSIGSFI